VQRLDAHMYPAPSPLLRDVEILVNNTLAYYTNMEDYNVQRIISKAKALQDCIVSMIEEIDPSLIKACEEIMKKRGTLDSSLEDGASTPLDLSTPNIHTLNGSGNISNISANNDFSARRSSARLRGEAPIFSSDFPLEPPPPPTKKQKTESSNSKEEPKVNSVNKEGSPVAHNEKQNTTCDINNNNKQDNVVSPTTSFSQFKKRRRARSVPIGVTEINTGNTEINTGNTDTNTEKSDNTNDINYDDNSNSSNNNESNSNGNHADNYSNDNDSTISPSISPEKSKSFELFQEAIHITTKASTTLSTVTTTTATTASTITATQLDSITNSSPSLIDTTTLPVPSPQEIEAIVDKERLKILVNILIGSTNGFSVEELVALHSKLYSVIHLHHALVDKTVLLQDLETIVHKYTVQTTHHKN